MSETSLEELMVPTPPYPVRQPVATFAVAHPPPGVPGYVENTAPVVPATEKVLPNIEAKEITIDNLRDVAKKAIQDVHNIDTQGLNESEGEAVRAHADTIISELEAEEKRLEQQVESPVERDMRLDKELKATTAEAPFVAEATKVEDFETTFEHPEKSREERLQELDSIIDHSLDVMKGARNTSDHKTFDIAGRMMMKARNEAARLRNEELSPLQKVEEAVEGIATISNKPDATPAEIEAAVKDLKDRTAEVVAAAPERRVDRPESLDDKIAKVRRDVERGAGKVIFDTAEDKQKLSRMLNERIAQLTAEKEKAFGRPLETARIEDDIAKLKYERDELNRPPTWFGRLKKRTGELYKSISEKIKVGWENAKGVRGFMKERVKGQGTAGIYEGFQGEKVRVGGTAVGEIVAAGSRDVMTARMLQDRAKAFGENQVDKNMTAEQAQGVYIDAHKEFVRVNSERNEEYIHETVVKAMAEYDIKMAKARTVWSGETAQERRGVVEAEIRAVLMRQRDTMSNKHTEDYVALVRKTFDPSWKARYGLAALEAVFAGIGISYIATKLLYGAIPATPPGMPPAPVSPGLEGPALKMHETISQTLWSRAHELGYKVTDPTKFWEFVKSVEVTNHLTDADLGVKMMKAAGDVHALPEGFLFKAPVALFEKFAGSGGAFVKAVI